MTGPVLYASLMIAAGFGIPVMAALNAALGARYASPAFAASLLFGVGLLVCVAYLLAAHAGPKPPAGAPLPFYYYLGGVFVAFYILSITWVAPRFGVGNAVAFVLLGQLLSMATIDHFGLLRAPVSPITSPRLVGLIVMTVGLFLAVRRG